MEDVNATQTFAANIRRELAARGWTQTQLAKACGWPPSRVAEILAADHSPRLDTVEAVANAFDLSTSALLLPVPENSLTPA